MRVPVVAVLLVLAASCGGDAPTETHSTFDITASAEQFFPPIQFVAAGDAVRWTFIVNPVDNLGHNVLFKPPTPGAPADIPQEVRSGTRTLVFPTKGDFHYVCDLHGGMTGEIIVQ